VTDGANAGDELSDAEELILDDIYTLSKNAIPPRLLTIADTASTPFEISDESDTGKPGNQLHLDCAITLMGPSGVTFEAVVMVEVDPSDGTISQIYLLALAPLTPETGYRLVGIDRDAARAKMAEVACVSFTRGTRITMSTGMQCKIEDLKVGDRILTRDDGPQTVRWIGQSTTRAVGAFAPIRIAQGTLNNANDLIVSPNHRLFVYQRHDELGAGRSEVLIKAKHLVNGTTVQRQEGGFVDYFQILFDDHQIIFAEGIAAESLQLDERTTPALPARLANELAGGHGKHGASIHQDYEISGNELPRGDTAEQLRRASSS
jgi:hypothetical protein